MLIYYSWISSHEIVDIIRDHVVSQRPSLQSYWYVPQKMLNLLLRMNRTNNFAYFIIIFFDFIILIYSVIEFLPSTYSLS